MDIRWKHPFTCCVCGPIGCGKTLFVQRFLTHLTTMCTVNFERILFYYAEWQEAYRTAFKPNAGTTIEFREGLPQTADYSRDMTKKNY